MRFTTYSKYHPEMADAVNLQGLLDQLSDFLLQSGFAGNSPSFWHDEMGDSERSVDGLRQAILQALAEQSRIVRVPLNRAGTLHRIGKRSSALLQELGREPTPSEIAEGMDISMEEVQKTLSISQNHLSLDAPLTPGEDNKLLDYLPDTQNPGPDSETFEHALTESIEEVLSTLKEREAKILRLYFGLDGPEPMTLEEIGSLLGITRERVRQIKEKALSRLRHVSRARALESFLA